MLKIYINGRFLGRRSTGVDRFAKRILFGLQALIAEGGCISGIELVLVIPDTEEYREVALPVETVRVGGRGGIFWEQWTFPRYVGKNGFVLNLCNTAPLWGAKCAVVIHDAAVWDYPATFSARFRIWYRFLLPLVARRAKYVFTVSEFSAGRLRANIGAELPEIIVLPESGEHILEVESDASVLEDFSLRKGEYFLAVSSMAKHKNFEVVARAALSLSGRGLKFVVAGGANSAVFGADSSSLTQSELQFVGYVSDAQLRALYENAKAFIFPSHYEGFGIPPLEAMECGCPVISSNAASMPEVCGDAALYFDPESSSDLANMLLSLDPIVLEKYRSAGLLRASQWRWESGAREIYNAISS